MGDCDAQSGMVNVVYTIVTKDGQEIVMPGLGQDCELVSYVSTPWIACAQTSPERNGTGPGASRSCLKQDRQSRVSDKEGKEGMSHISVKHHIGRLEVLLRIKCWSDMYRPWVCFPAL